MMERIVEELIEGKRLSQIEAFELLDRITVDELNDAQIASILTVLRVRGLDLEELMGFKEALLEKAIKINLDRESIDLCGTGGDGKDTFNISTLASVVVAGAGYKVVKHGNYGVSSSCGSSDVLQALGYQFTNDQNLLEKQLEKANICFLHAPLFHPSMKAVAPVRRSMGVKTIFNMLGPLVNPARPFYKVTGVFSREVGRMYAYILQKEKCEYSIVHSMDVYDEISLTTDTLVVNRNGERLIRPHDFGLNKLQPETIQGGDSIEDAKRIFLNVLNNQATTEQRNVVCANAALAIQTITNKSLQDAMEEANESLSSGRALEGLKYVLQ